MSGRDLGVDPLRRVLFIVGDFPAPSQTFILRELREMHRRGYAVNVLAIDEVRRDDLDDDILAIRENALFAKRILWRSGRRARLWRPRPSSWFPLFKRAIALPHRTLYHRFRFLAALAFAVRLAPIVRDRGYEYLHAHFAAFQTELAMCLSWLTGIPYGMTEHAYGLWRDRNILPEKIAGARLVLTCTEHNLKQLKRLAPEHAGKIRLARHGIEVAQWRWVRDSTAPDTDHEWLAVGRLVPKKGFEHLIEALGLLRDRGIPARATVIGDGPERGRLAARIRALRLTERVDLAGELSNAVVRERLRKCYGLVVPSVADRNGDVDGIPNVILEAMASSTPVIGTAISGIPEIVRDRENGLLARPGSAESLAKAMIRLTREPALAARLGAGGRETVEREFDVRAAVDAQVKLLSEAAATR